MGLCGAVVAHSTHSRESPGLIPGRSGKIWAVFPIYDVEHGVVTSLSRKVNCGNPVVTLALYPVVMGSLPPQVQGPMSRRWAPRLRAASAYAPNFTTLPYSHGGETKTARHTPNEVRWNYYTKVVQHFYYWMKLFTLIKTIILFAFLTDSSHCWENLRLDVTVTPRSLTEWTLLILTEHISQSFLIFLDSVCRICHLFILKFISHFTDQSDIFTQIFS